MRLARLEAENYRKLVGIDITFDANHRMTEISGKNGNGKSTIWEAIYVCLKGLSVAPDEPLRTGTDRCFIRSTLVADDPKEGLIITARFNRGADDKVKSTLTIETPEGARFSSPAKHLNKLISDHILDPQEFLDLKQDEQLKVFQSFVPGYDFAKMEGLNRSDYEKRTDVNRDAKKARAAAEMIIVEADGPTEPVDVDALVQKLQEAGDENSVTEQRKARRDRFDEQAKAHRAKADAIKASIEAECDVVRAQNSADVADLEARIADLQRQIDGLQASIDAKQEGLAAKVAARTERINALATAEIISAEDLEEQLRKADPLPAIHDTVAMATEIKAARETNAAVARRSERDKHLADATRLEAESKALTEAMDARDAAKRDALSKAALPVPNLEIGAAAIRLNGQLFSQASTAERYRTVFALALAKRPTVRLFWFREGHALDDDTLKVIEGLAEEFDCYVLFETVRAIGKEAIVIEQGRVRKATEKAAAGAAA